MLVITDRRRMGPDRGAAVAAAIAGGATVVMLREKDLATDDLVREGTPVAAACRAGGALLVVNGDVAAARMSSPDAASKESVPGVRGGLVEGVRVHSIRLPGLLARMECLFGGPGDTLTLRHDTLTRESFMPGVLLAVRKVRGLSGLTYGLEHVL